MTLRERIGIDLGRRIRLEDGIEWGATHGVRYLDIQLDTAANAVTTFDDARAAKVRAARERYGIQLGLHTARRSARSERGQKIGIGSWIFR